MMRTLNTTVFTSAVTVCTALCLLAASPARADEVVTQSRTVHLGGLDLNAPPDQAVLRFRLMAAANKVCTDGGGTELNDSGFLECRTAAFKHAWAEASVLIAAAKSRALVAARVAPASAQPQTVVALAAPGTAPVR